MSAFDITCSQSLTPLQFTWLAGGVSLLCCSVVLFIRGKTSLSLFIMTVGAFTLRLLMTNTDPFLYDWDEQYHALVAKNLAVHPGTPMLYENPLLPVDISRWADNHIWLHKPPLFLWLIALSIKFFGATPFAVKLPSVIITSLMVPALFSLVKRLSNERAGWIAALLMAAHSYFVQLVSGFRNTDHNDLIFAAFVLFSFVAWLKYSDAKRKRDAILAGALVGCAILVKWLPGMLVYMSWGLWLLAQENRRNKARWLEMAVAVIATLIVVLPWHIRTFMIFPAEAAYEMNYNMLHFSIAIEGHEGPWYYHLDAIRELMGWTMAVLVVPGLFFFAVNNLNDKRPLYILVALFFFFGFYSLAATKMPLFMLPLIPFFLGGIAVMLAKVTETFAAKKTISALVFMLVVLFVVDAQDIITKHSSLSDLAWYREQMSRDGKRSAWIQRECGEGNWVIFNYPRNSRASFMFYTGMIAYDEKPTVQQQVDIQNKGIKIAVIVPADSSFIRTGNTLEIILPDSLK